MKKALEDVCKELDEKIPRDVVETREDTGGRQLSYLSGHYVIDRLNKVFGHMGWSNSVLEIKEVVNETSKGKFPAYLVKTRLEINVCLTPPFGNISKVSEAYGYGCDKSPRNAHELAIKEAVTDSLKVAAKNLGMSMGLALYDKTQENVDDGPQSNQTEKSYKPEVLVKIPEAASAPTQNTERLKEVIRAHVRAALKKGVKVGEETLTMDLMKRILKKDYGHENLDEVAESNYPKVLEMVRGLSK